MSEELQDLQQAIVDNIVNNSQAISATAAKLSSNGESDSNKESRRLALLACLCRANWLLADLKRIERFVR